MRLAKFLAAAGVASRRASEQLIRSGRVAVNGETVTDSTPDMARWELAIAVPLIVFLLLMTAWPNGVMERIVS